MNTLNFGDKVTLVAVDDLPQEDVIFVEDAGNGCFIAEYPCGCTEEVPYAQIKVQA